MARPSLTAAFKAYSKAMAETTGVASPRSYVFDNLDPEAQDVIHRRAEFAGTHIIPRLEHVIGLLQGRREGWTEATDEQYKDTKTTELRKMLDRADSVRSHKVDLSIPSMTHNLDSLVRSGFSAARAETRFRQQHTGSTELEIPTGGDFYTLHPQAYKQAADLWLPSEPGNPFGPATRLIHAGGQFSSNSPPREELIGMSGGTRLYAAGDLGVSISHHAAKYLNQAAQAIHGKNGPVIESGYHKTGELPEAHAALVYKALRNFQVAGTKGYEKLTIHPALKQGLKFDKELYDDYGSAAVDMVRGASTGGLNSMYRFLRVMRAPETFSLPSDYMKVGTYAATNASGLRDHEALREAATHMVGAATHGNRWWDENPGALEHVLRYQNHPFFRNPTAVGDVHMGRALANPESSMPFADIKALDPMIRPEHFLVAQNEIGGDFPTVYHQGKAISPVAQGYLAQEKAMQDVSIPFPMRGRTGHLSPQVVQALGWVRQQLTRPTFANKVAAGKLSPWESDVRRDPSLHPNPVIFRPNR